MLESFESERFVFRDSFGLIRFIDAKAFSGDDMGFTLIGELDFRGFGGKDLSGDTEFFGGFKKDKVVGVGNWFH